MSSRAVIESDISAAVQLCHLLSILTSYLVINNVKPKSNKCLYLRAALPVVCAYDGRNFDDAAAIGSQAWCAVTVIICTGGGREHEPSATPRPWRMPLLRLVPMRPRAAALPRGEEARSPAEPVPVK